MVVTYDDMANYEGKWMEPLHTSFMGYYVYAGDGWSQGVRPLAPDVVERRVVRDLENPGRRLAFGAMGAETQSTVPVLWTDSVRLTWGSGLKM